VQLPPGEDHRVVEDTGCDRDKCTDWFVGAAAISGMSFEPMTIVRAMSHKRLGLPSCRRPSGYNSWVLAGNPFHHLSSSLVLALT
jgi:hypothetical protein